MRSNIAVWTFVALAAVFVSIQNAFASSTVVIVQPSIGDPALRAAARMLQAELLIAGFNVRTVKANPGASPRDEVERIRGRGQHAFATLMLVGKGHTLSADLWIRDHISAKTSIGTIQLDHSLEDSPDDLAVHAAELWRASLMESLRPSPSPLPQHQEPLPPDAIAWSLQITAAPNAFAALQVLPPPPQFSQSSAPLHQRDILPQFRARLMSTSVHPPANRSIPRIPPRDIVSQPRSKWEHRIPHEANSGAFTKPRLELSAALLQSFEGFGSAFTPGARFSYPIPSSLSARASFFSSVVDSSIEANEGTATFSQYLAHIELIRGFSIPHTPLLITASGGLGGYVTHIEGIAKAQYTGHEKVAWAVSGQVGAGLCALLSNRVTISLETQGLLVLPAPIMQFADRNVGGLGLASLFISLGFGTSFY